MERNNLENNRVREDYRPMDIKASMAMEELRREYAQIHGVYEAAIREINARLQTLDSDFSFKHMHNPIHHIGPSTPTISRGTSCSTPCCTTRRRAR